MSRLCIGDGFFAELSAWLLIFSTICSSNGDLNDVKARFGEKYGLSLSGVLSGHSVNNQYIILDQIKRDPNTSTDNFFVK
ncbi:hypothetical protein BJ875DRAFT_74014 [Amylocarpus encephaloides]|uniref:Homing endonuclease LAGLIDADG domain-containing protein n=1 Tax=Amylocarpus encephaloides TaxID=45428 RepID=A0A9P7YFL2_9HELO|nr:hypothetical protein BJ875DRAFT_74014 [Amylocarpus encephaloides]